MRGLAALDAVAGVAADRLAGADVGDRAGRRPALLARHGFRYDSGLMDADRPVPARRRQGRRPTLVELPVHWASTTGRPYVYLPGLSGSGAIASPAEVVGRWTLELDALVADGGLFMLTNHPFVSGRPSRAAAPRGR